MTCIYIIFHNASEIHSFLYNILISTMPGIIVSLFTIYIIRTIDRYNRTYSIPKSNLNSLINKIKNLKTEVGQRQVTVFGPHFERTKLYLDITQNEHDLRWRSAKKSNISNTVESWLKAGTGAYPIHRISSEKFNRAIIRMQKECSSIKPSWLKILLI